MNDTIMLHDRMNLSDVFLPNVLQFVPSPSAKSVSGFAYISVLSRDVHVESGSMPWAAAGPFSVSLEFTCMTRSRSATQKDFSRQR
jgi:hypothetical protein